MICKLFEYYKKKYKLDVDLLFLPLELGILGSYDQVIGLITIDKAQIEKLSLENKEKNIKFVLLHELKHAIDLRNKYEYNPRNLEKIELKADEWARKRYYKDKK